MRKSSLISGVVLLACASMPAWAGEGDNASITTALDTPQGKALALPDDLQQITNSLQEIISNQRTRLDQAAQAQQAGVMPLQAINTLLARIVANQEMLIKQNAETQKLLTRLMLEQTRFSALKGLE